MNKPHVNKLHYKIVTKDNVDYLKAPAVNFEDGSLKMTAINNAVVFEMKKHFSSEKDAKIIIDDFLNKWEIIINQGKPPALPERLPEFDNSWNIRKPPTVNCSKFKKEGGFR